MTPDRWRYTSAYLAEVFGGEDDVLRWVRSESAARGLPPIAISADVGRFLGLMAGMTEGRLAIEVGTLAGYSAIWIARALPKGRLITIEKRSDYADLAEEAIERAGVSDRVEVRRGAALDVLAQMSTELADESVDVVFLDAVKSEYSDYLALVRPLLAPGGLLIADNVLGTSGWWIDEEDKGVRNAVDTFNRAVAADEGFETAGLSVREGLLIARATTAKRCTQRV